MTSLDLLVPSPFSDHVASCLAAIELYNRQLQAVITVTGDSASMLARQQDEARRDGRFVGALGGMTVTLKDVIHTAGIRTTNGSDIDRDFVPLEDAEVVRRLKQNGAIIIGKANLHEYAYGGTTQNRFHGSCRNPWDPNCIPGGSSGGSGAAVATGMCQLSLGTDTAGSGNLPAALCGVAALRPTAGAISNRGVTPLSPFFDTISPMARRVVDIARAFQCLSGYDAADPFSSRSQADGTLPTPGERLDGMLIGIPTTYFCDGVEPGIGAAVAAAQSQLRNLGATLVEVVIPGVEEARFHYEHLFHTDAAVVHRQRYADSAERLGPDTRERLERFGRSFSGMDYAGSLAWMRRWQWQIARLFQNVDLIVHPTAPVTAPTVLACASTTTATQRLAMFLYPWCLAQVPVMSLPCAPSTNGMPCGMAVVGPQWSEKRLFRVGAALQEVTDWHLREPVLPPPNLVVMEADHD